MDFWKDIASRLKSHSFVHQKRAQTTAIRQRAEKTGTFDSFQEYEFTSIHRYNEAFKHVLEGKGIHELADTFPELIIVDAMSPSVVLRNLFTLLRKDQPKKGLAISYEDLRNRHIKNIDEQYNITQVSLDVNDIERFFEAIDKWREGKLLTMFMERGYGGLGFVTHHRYYYAKIVQGIWERMDSAGSIILLELPPEHVLDAIGVSNAQVEQWILTCKQHGILVSYQPGMWGPNQNINQLGHLKLIKNKDQELPAFPGTGTHTGRV